MKCALAVQICFLLRFLGLSQSSIADSYANQNAESIKERSDGEDENGEKTPTYEDRSRKGYRSDLTGAVRKTFNG